MNASVNPVMASWREVPDASPDRPVLMDAISSLAAVVKPRAAAAAAALNSKLEATLLSAEQQAATMRSEAHAAAEARSSGLAPWKTLGEQFSILEDELKARIMALPSSEANFSWEVVQRMSHREAPILPGCSPQANAALNADAALVDLRFRLVPARMSEESFWRAYFWHVANIKCELLHDWHTANSVRRQAVIEDEACLSTEVAPDVSATSLTQEAPRADDAAETSMALIDLDAEFERLVASPS